MNSSTHSESALLSNASPTQSITKVKQKENKENKLQRFSGAVVSGSTVVFGKIKSLWSHSSTDLGLNILAETDPHRKHKSKEILGLDFESLFVLLFLMFVYRFCCMR